MKTKILISAIAISFLSIILIIGCKKELNNFNTSGNNLAQMRWEGLTGIRSEHGLLVFDNRETFNRTLELLAREDTAKEYSSEYNSISTTVYSCAGGDSGVTTTTATVAFGNLISGVIIVDTTTSTNRDTTLYDPTESIIYNRVLDDFERKFNFKSLRKVIENKEIEYLDGGSIGDDPSHHFVAGQYLRTLLNPALEIQIGDTICRYMDEYRMIIITDGDYETLEAIRGNPYDYYQFSNVTELATYGELTWFRDNRDRDADCEANFAIADLGAGTYQFYDQSSSQTSWLTNWYWNFGDPSSGSNNTSTIADPAHVFIASPPYNVSLTITCANGCTDTYVFTIGSCQTTWNYTQNSNTVSFLAVNPGGGYNYSYSWDFGDGATSTFMGPNHTYTGTGNFTACLTVTNLTTGCVSSPLCQTIVVSAITPSSYCKETADTWGGITYASDKKFSGHLFIYNNFFGSRVGVETINYKKKSNGNWKEEKAAYLQDGIWGTFYDGANTCATEKIMHDYEAIYDDDYDKKSISKSWSPEHIWGSTHPNKVAVKQNTLHSFHRINNETILYLNLWQ